MVHTFHLRCNRLQVRLLKAAVQVMFKLAWENLAADADLCKDKGPTAVLLAVKCEAARV